MAVVDGRLLVAGGFWSPEIEATSRFDAYDPEADSWTRLPDMPVAVTHVNFAMHRGTLWLAGGFVGDHPGPVTDEVWKFDLETGEWTRGPPLPEPRGGGALVARGDSLHYFGGHLPDRNTNSADHWVLELPTDPGASWTRAAPMPEPRSQLGAVEVAGKIYAVGGQFFHDTAPGPVDLDFVHAYDPETDRWRRVASLPRARSHIEGGTFAHRGRIVVVGGRELGAGREVIPDVSMYDPALDLWLALPPLPRGRYGPAAGSFDSLIVVHGGSSAGWAASPQANLWKMRTNGSWERHPSMPVGLREVAAGIVGNGLYVIGEGSPATLRFDLSRDEWASPMALSFRPCPGGYQALEAWNGRLYVFGGFGTAASRTQIYDPATDTWTLGAEMPFRAGSSMSAVIGDQIYVVGGSFGGAPTAEAARYDPKLDRWARLSPMPLPRSRAAAGTDGKRLYVFGGDGPRADGAGVGDNDVVQVQIYDPASKSWRRLSTGSAPAPAPRWGSGMGRAVFLHGEFYLLGGYEWTEGGRNRLTSDRVEIFDPARNRWRTGPAMPTARAGMSPAAIADRIYVAGGAAQGGNVSSALEVLNPPIAP